MIQTVSNLRHPPGVEDVHRGVEVNFNQFAVDLGDRLGVEFAYGLYRELPEALAFLRSLPEQGRLVDVGANFGFFTVLGARQIGPNGAVLALEPHPRARALLQENVAANHLERVVMVSGAGAAEANGRRRFHFAAESAFSGLADTGRARIAKVSNVKVRTLDSLAEEHAWERVHGIKIDVEGFEYAVLDGAQALLTRSPDVVVMMEASPKNLNAERWERLRAALDKCARLGLKPWWIDWRDGRIRAMASLVDGVGRAAGTIFLARKAGDGWKRLQAAAQSVVPDGKPGAAPVEPGSLAGWLHRALAIRTAVAPKAVSSANNDPEGKRLAARLAMLESESRERLALYRNAEGKHAALREAGERAELQARQAERAAEELRSLLAKCEAELAKRGESLKDLTGRWTRAQEEVAARKLAAEKAELRAFQAERAAEELRSLLAKCEAELAKRGESLKDLTGRWTRTQEEVVARKLAAEKAELRARQAEHAVEESRSLLAKCEAELAKRGESLKDLTGRWTRAQEEVAARKLTAEKAELRARQTEHAAEEMRAMLAKCENEFAKRGESLRDLTARWTRAQAEAAQQAQRAQELEREGAALGENLAMSQQRIQHLEGELTAAATRIGDLGRDREALTVERARLGTQVGALEEQLAELSARHAALEARFQSPSALARQWFRRLGAPRRRSPD